MTGLATLVVFAPLVAVIAALAHPRGAAWIGISASLLAAAAALAMFVSLPPQGVPLIPLGGWSLPLGIQWRVDGLSVLMLLLTAGVGVAISAYAGAYFPRAGAAARSFWPLWMLLLAGLNALFLSNDLFNLYVTLEILGLSAVALVTLAGSGTADRAAFRYLLVSLLGSLLYLSGVALFYAGYGTLDILALKEIVRGTPATWVAFGLMVAGLLLKSAVFPLHFWLPPAHSSAPAPVSALLSALVVKGSLFILLRLWLDVAPEIPGDSLGMLMGLAGVMAITWGSVCALRTRRLKLLVAYSTVAQLGYVMFFFPLSGSPDAADAALGGVVYFIIAHACAKAAMFLSAGNLQRAAGHDSLEDLGRASAALPVSMFAFGLAGASIMGLPPSGGFIAKWTLLNAALAAGQWVWLVVMAAGGLLSAAYVFRVVALSFRAEARDGDEIGLQPVSPVMQWAPLLLALVAVALGFNALPVLNAVSIDTAPTM